MKKKILIALAAVYLAAVAVWALGPVPGTDNYMSIVMTSGSPRVNVVGANFHVEGTSLFDSTVTLPASTALTSPTLTSPVATNGTFATPVITTPTVNGLLVGVPHAFVVADVAGGGPGVGTLTPTSNMVILTCSDSDGCTVTMGESGMLTGTMLYIVNTSANTANFADTGGVSELAGAAALAQYDSLVLMYATNTWVEIAFSDN